MTINRIEFKKDRDFSNTINATVEFLKQDIKPLMKSILYIAGPAIVLSGILFALIIDSLMGFLLTQDTNVFTVDFVLYILVFALAALAAQIFVLAVTLEYIHIHVNEAPQTITPDQVWTRVKESFWGYVGHGLILFMIFMVLYALTIGAFAIFAAIFGQISPIFAIFFAFIPWLALMYFITVFSLYYPIYIFENRSISDFSLILSRCFKLIKNNWWKTFGIVFITSTLVGIVSGAFFLPPYIITLSNLFTLDGGTDAEVAQALGQNVFQLFFWALYIIVREFLFFIVLVGLAVQYFSLVEKKEAVGLMQTIGNLDTEASAPPKLSDAEENEDY